MPIRHNFSERSRAASDAAVMLAVHLKSAFKSFKARVALSTALLIAAIAWLVPPVDAQTDNCLAPKWRSLRMYQSLMYANRPDMAALGFAPAHIIDRDIWVDEQRRHEVSPTKLRARVAQLAAQGGIIVLDIEHFPLTGSDERVAPSVQKLARGASIARAASSGVLVGYYGLVPLSEYWRPINGLAQGGFTEWRKDNQRLAPIAASVDVNMPSLYTHYDDREGWVRQARTLVCEARRMSDKPVIAFIWPEFHPGAKPAGTPIPADYWRLQLETLAEIADGIVIWGGFDLAKPGPQSWDPHAPWWRETVSFLKRHRSAHSLRPIG